MGAAHLRRAGFRGRIRHRHTTFNGSRRGAERELARLVAEQDANLGAAGLSAATVRQVKAVLHRSCRLAHKWSGPTLPNPAVDADLPTWSLNERRPEVRAPEADEVRRLLPHAEAVDVDALVSRRQGAEGDLGFTPTQLECRH